MLLSNINPDELNDELINKIVFDFPEDDGKNGDCILVFGASGDGLIGTFYIVWTLCNVKKGCPQLLQDELRKMMNIDNIVIENYVVVNDELMVIKPDIISLSKNLSKLSETTLKWKD